MNRRVVLKSIFISGVSVVFLNSCDFSSGKFKIQLKHISIDENGAKELASLIKKILPVEGIDQMEGQSAFVFMLKMIDDCEGPEMQQNFNDSFQYFMKYCKNEKGKSYSDFTDQEVSVFMKSADEGKDLPKEILNFYSVVKSYVIQYYTGTKEYMTTYLKYNIIPNPYQGCIPVK